MKTIAEVGGRFRLPDHPVLCLVTNREVSRLPLVEAVREAVAGGVDWVQVRERGLSDAAYLSLLEEIAEAIRAGARERAGAAQLWVNSRVDLALLTGAQGVHLGSRSVNPVEARQLVGLNTGVSFGKEGSGFMRLNVGCPRATLEEAMRRLKGAMEEDV